MLREHRPHLEDFWVDCVDEHEVRRRDWSRLTLDQMRVFMLGWDLPNLVDDYSYMFDQGYYIESAKPFPKLRWYEREISNIFVRPSFVLDKSQRWLKFKMNGHDASSP